MKLAAAPNARGSAAPAPAPALVALARCGWRSCSVPRGSAKTSGLGRPRKGGSACRRVLAAGRPVCAARWERCRGHVPVQPWLWASGCGGLSERAEAKYTRVSACATCIAGARGQARAKGVITVKRVDPQPVCAGDTHSGARAARATKPLVLAINHQSKGIQTRALGGWPAPVCKYEVGAPRLWPTSRRTQQPPLPRGPARPTPAEQDVERHPAQQTSAAVGHPSTTTSSSSSGHASCCCHLNKPFGRVSWGEGGTL